MSGRRTIGPVDTIWLNMDRPNNLMVIDSITWLDGAADWERYKAVVKRRMVDRYPVFSQIPIPAHTPISLPHWEDDPAFDLERHFVNVTLPAPGDRATLQRYIEQQMHVPFDRSHPLWEVHLIDGFETGSAVLSRFHHSLADGIALTQVLLSLTDETSTGDLEELEEPGADEPAAHARRGGLLGAASSVTGFASSALRESWHLLGDLPHLANPSHVVDAVSLAADTGLIANKLLLGSNPPTPISGTPGIPKRAVWAEPRDLGPLKKVGRLSGATLNDVLVAAVSAAINHYLVDSGAEAVDLSTMVPVNVRPLDKPLPRELGNQFALVLLPLPTGNHAPLERLAEAKRRMDSIKDSPEATLTFGLISAIGRTNPEIERRLVNFFSAKAIGVTTNVIGPKSTRYIAGTRIVGTLGWVPGSGDQTVGVCIYSYDDRVHVGFKTDATVVPYAEKLVHAFDHEMDELVRIAHAA
ncbi:MAG: wax ester/triacylglycerol synthase family O-acyltransferase [Actinomycetia bacterium]|jgi:WS/DGAT/MGAT family acyltransferase|nr:wax ester/triacylglycerol synthase family O-acyltransferase [Actinomycetes bacterium]